MAVSNRTLSNSHDRVFGLDAMRVIAVVSVVFGHFLEHAKVAPWIYNLKRVGIFGVEIFFVLSGYLIGGIIIHEIKAKRFSKFADLGRFWFRRWMRTLPLYYLFFFLYLRLEWKGPERFTDHLEYLAFLQNFAWRIPDFYIVSWSLPVEEFFYLFFPFFLLIALKRLAPVKALSLSIGTFLIVPLVIRALTAPYPDWEQFEFQLRMIVIKRIDAPMYGAAAVFIKEYYPAIWQRLLRWTPLSAIALLAVCLHIYIFDNHDLWVAPWNWPLQTFFFSIMTILVALMLPAVSQWKLKKSSKTPVWAAVITFISTTSYSIYLVHPLVISWVRKFFEQTPGRIEWLDEQFFWLSLINLTLIILFSSLAYYGWERPFMRLRDRWVARKA